MISVLQMPDRNYTPGWCTSVTQNVLPCRLHANTVVHTIWCLSRYTVSLLPHGWEKISCWSLCPFKSIFHPIRGFLPGSVPLVWPNYRNGWEMKSHSYGSICGSQTDSVDYCLQWAQGNQNPNTGHICTSQTVLLFIS